MARGTIHHIGLSVREPVRAEADFYAPVLGFLGYRRVSGSGGVTFWRDPEGGPTLHLVATDGHLNPPASDHCAFSVESREKVDRLHDLLGERNIAVLSPPAEYPHFGTGHFAVFFQDPDGRVFEVMHRPSASSTRDAGQSSATLGVP